MVLFRFNTFTLLTAVIPLAQYLNALPLTQCTGSLCSRQLIGRGPATESNVKRFQSDEVDLFRRQMEAPDGGPAYRCTVPGCNSGGFINQNALSAHMGVHTRQRWEALNPPVGGTLAGPQAGTSSGSQQPPNPPAGRGRRTLTRSGTLPTRGRAGSRSPSPGPDSVRLLPAPGRAPVASSSSSSNPVPQGGTLTRSATLPTGGRSGSRSPSPGPASVRRLPAPGRAPVASSSSSSNSVPQAPQPGRRLTMPPTGSPVLGSSGPIPPISRIQRRPPAPAAGPPGSSNPARPPTPPRSQTLPAFAPFPPFPGPPGSSYPAQPPMPQQLPPPTAGPFGLPNPALPPNMPPRQGQSAADLGPQLFADKANSWLERNPRRQGP